MYISPSIYILTRPNDNLNHGDIWRQIKYEDTVLCEGIWAITFKGLIQESNNKLI